MKITSKGQVTIPQELRERAGLMPGCEVEFSEARDGRVFIKKLTGASRGRGIVDRLRGQGSVRMTTEEILNLTRGR
jgi:AbrB family looped-hinge helix DNA binding protein